MYLKNNEKIGGIFNRVKKALITDITGQDGSYLTELLLQKGYVPEASLSRRDLYEMGKYTALFVRLLPQRYWSNHNR